MSDNITVAIATNGESVTKQPIIKGIRVVKKETLKLITGWISRSNNPQMVLDNFIPPLLDALLLDYQMCSVASAREPEVLGAIAAIVNKLEGQITGQVEAVLFYFSVLLVQELFLQVGKIFDAVFECTLQMINKDFEEFPEHRIGFYEIIQVKI